MSKQTLLIDLDGTLAEYTGWVSAEHIGAPLPNARAAMYILAKKYTLVCFCARLSQNPESAEFVVKWLARHGFPQMKVTNKKGPAHLSIDDRALLFSGQWTQELLDRIQAFEPWWKANGSGGVPQASPLSSPADAPSESDQRTAAAEPTP